MSTTWLRIVRITATADEAREAVAGHRAQVARFGEEGRLAWAAVFADGDGFVEAFRARDRLEAEALAAASPLVEAGLASCLVRRLDDDAGVAGA